MRKVSRVSKQDKILIAKDLDIDKRPSDFAARYVSNGPNIVPLVDI